MRKRLLEFKKLSLVIVMVLALAMTMTLVVGCNENENQDSSPSPENTPIATAPGDDIGGGTPPDGDGSTQGGESEEIVSRRAALLEEAEFMFRGYFYEEAIALLNEDEELINDETRELESRIVEEKENLILFEGQIKHIFFHSLILYPEHLFPNLNIPTGGYNEGFVYQSEFKRMLPQILERGFVLYNIHDVFSEGENGRMVQNEIWLPPGRRPLILSIDDPTYHYGVGFANRLLVTDDGKLRSEVITPDGETIITDDGDIQLILNDFVREHPEFSWRGHKGIIAATGFMGIFGYDLLTEESRREATRVAEYLKDTGWIFANHSYTHSRRSGWWAADARVENIRSDMEQWRDRIEPIIGSTNILIAPFGFVLPPHAMEVVLEFGYNIYCNVDFNQPVFMRQNGRYVLQGRIEIGGFSMKTPRWAEYLTDYFFDVAYVLDSHRPPIISGT